MPKKKSVKRTAQRFSQKTNQILHFLDSCSPRASDEHVSWLHEYAVIRLYREFERLVLGALVGAINNDTSVLSRHAGVQFPKHLTDEVCEYLVTGGGYFDFKGRDGLIQRIKRFLPKDHYLLDVLRGPRFEGAINSLYALRNFAAHASPTSKVAAKKAIGALNLGSAGAWLKKQGRFGQLVESLQLLGNEVEKRAPY
jgi:hypothetical protein